VLIDSIDRTIHNVNPLTSIEGVGNEQISTQEILERYS